VVNVDLTQVSGSMCLTTRLLTGSAGRLLHLRRYEFREKNGNDDFADAMRELVAVIDNQVEIAEQQRVMRKPIEALAPQEIVWRARWHLERLTREDAMLAGQLVDRLVSEAPEWSEAIIQAGFVKAWSIWASRGSERQILELRSLGARAVAADKFDARGHLLIGMADTWLRQSARARSALEEAISLNPSLCPAYMQLGSALYLSGDPNAALTPMETALRLNARDTQAFCVHAEHGMVKLMLGDYESAAASAELALLRKPGYWFAHVIKINGLWRSGDSEGAQRAHADLLHAKPRFSLRYLDWVPFVDERWPRALREGVEKAEQVSFAST
jgi:tetratricopeptide (TPR) repeat protein